MLLETEIPDHLKQYFEMVDHPTEPCVVCDPFLGSGTTCCVSLEHGRRSIGIDLSEDYLMNNAIPRIEGTLMNLGRQELTGRQAKQLQLGRSIG